MLNANRLSNTQTITDPTPVTVANPPSNTTDIVAVLHDLEFTLSPRRPVDEEINLLRIDPLRQLAARFETPMPDQNKGKFQLRKFGMKELHARGMIVQGSLEFFFTPALTA